MGAAIPKRTDDTRRSHVDGRELALVDETVEAGIAARRVPAMASGFMEPSFDLHAVDVGEHPHTIEVAFELTRQVRGRFGQLATEAELLDRARSAVGAHDGQHQRVPVEP